MRELVLNKQDQRYVFRYRPGEEAKLLRSLVDLVQDPGSGLDWFDAAVLSHQMGQRMGAQLEALRRSSLKAG